MFLLESWLSNHLTVRCSFMRYNFITWIYLIGLRVLLLESRLSNHLMVRCSFMRYDFITRIRLIGLRVFLLESRLSNHLTVRCSFMRYNFIIWIRLIGFESVLAWKSIIKSLNGEMFFHEVWFYNLNTLNWLWECSCLKVDYQIT